MNILNKIVVATLPAVPKSIVRKFANRYIAGDSVADAVRVVKELNREGIMATLDVLGEDITRREEALQSRDEILDVYEAIHREKLDANVSVKLSQLGLKLDRQFCLETTRSIVLRARDLNNFLRIDMEDSTCTDDTIWVYRQLRKEFTNLGIALQGYLKRTAADADGMIRDGLKNFRLCKGIYIEPEEIAYKGHEIINKHYIAVLEAMLKQGAYVGIATHDKALVDAAYGMISNMKLKRTDYEFQMLLGVRPDLRAKIVRDNHRLRVYVPFGHHWYRYSIRRFKENPQMAGYVFKAIFRRDRLN